MPSFRNLAAAASFAALFGAGILCRCPQAHAGQPVKADATPGPKPPDLPSPEAANPNKNTERTHDIPVTAGHPAKGLKIPYFDSDGKMQMIFVIGEANRIDQDHVAMSDMQIETFDEHGQHEIAIDLPASTFDLNTSVITTKRHVTIRRDDFVLTGEAMQFNTKTKQGSLGGGVHMVAFNLDNSTPAPAVGAPKMEPKKKEKGPTDITSVAATFDQRGNIAIFTDKVVVKDPEFNVTCDKLTTYLKDENAGKKSVKPAMRPAIPTPTPAPDGKVAAEAPKGSGKLERAVAEMNPGGGRVEITQDKKEADGSITHSIGHGEKADYNAATGEIQLFGRPDVLKGADSVIATDDATQINMTRDGHMETTGPSKTVIVKKDESGKKKGETEVTSGLATFDQKKHLAVFTGEVVVKDPEFNVVCDKLTAFLKHGDADKPGNKGTTKPSTPNPKEGKPGDSTGGLERAIAEANEGNRLEITQDKTEADGSVTHAVGHGTKADYNAITGDVQLFGKPEVQKGADWVIATADNTVVSMNRDGHMATDGPSRTIIVDQDAKPDTGKKEKEKGPTEVTSGKSTFDQKAHIAIFVGDVVVKDPEFNVTCDKLTAYLKHDDAEKPKAKGGRISQEPAALLVAASPGSPDAVKKPASAGGLERAVAEMTPPGRLEITQDRKEADGSVTHAIGHGTKADYNAINGDIKLIGKPDVKKGTDWLVATEDRTVITLNRDGRTHADGPSKTVIIDKGETGIK